MLRRATLHCMTCDAPLRSSFYSIVIIYTIALMCSFTILSLVAFLGLSLFSVDAFSGRIATSSHYSPVLSRRHHDVEVAMFFPRHSLGILSARSKTGSQDEEESPKQLAPEKVAEMVEVSFVNACLQLAKGYVVPRARGSPSEQSLDSHFTQYSYYYLCRISHIS